MFSVSESPAGLPGLSRRTLLRALPPALVAAVVPRALAFEWQLVEHAGRDYIRASDIQKFYGFKLQREGRHVWFRTQALLMKWTLGTDDIFINNVKFCLSYPIIERNGDALVSRVDLAKLLHPVIRPSHILFTQLFSTVVIDAGHGGTDSGAPGIYGSEKTYTLDTSFRLKKRLEALGFKTVLTRSTDVFIELVERVRIANTTPNCVFVSIHYNAHGPTAQGFETFALAPQGTASTDKAIKGSDMFGRRGNLRDSENIALATAVHANCLYRLKPVIDRGVKRARFNVLTGVEKPGILVEGGFVSNASEGARIHRPEFRQMLAEAIAGGIINFRNALQKRTPSRVPLRTQMPPQAKNDQPADKDKKEKE